MLLSNSDIISEGVANLIGKIYQENNNVKFYQSAYHGLSSDKANAFAAVPYVLMNGKKFKTDIEYKGKNEDRYVFAAPITINKNGKNTDYFCEVVVKNTDKIGNQQGKQRFYLHEVELKEKLADVFAAPQGGTSTSSKSIIADLVNKFNPNVTNNEPQIYFQSVYHGTPHRFDKFSTEHIGEGEGNQAHGLELYFAKDKNTLQNMFNLNINYKSKYGALANATTFYAQVFLKKAKKSLP